MPSVVIETGWPLVAAPETPSRTSVSDTPEGPPFAVGVQDTARAFQPLLATQVSAAVGAAVSMRTVSVRQSDACPTLSTIRLSIVWTPSPVTVTSRLPAR